MRFLIYKIAEPQWSFGWNTYCEILTPKGVGRTIGAYMNVGSRCLSLVWRRA